MPILSEEKQSPIITAFLFPNEQFNFENFIHLLKREAMSFIRGN